MGCIAFVAEQFYEDASRAVVPLLDRGYLLGDGTFETMRVYETVPFALELHLDRLWQSAELLGIPIPYGREALRTLLARAVKLSGLVDAYLRVTLTRGPGAAGLRTIGSGPSTLSILVSPLQPYSTDALAFGIETTVVNTRRVPNACLDSRIKSTNYLPQINAKRELEPQGILEGIQLALDSQVVGGTASNIFLVRADEIVTPWLESGCLPGITRATLLQLARAQGARVSEQRVSLDQVSSADEVFFCGTLMEILPVRSLRSGARFPAPGRQTLRLRAALRDQISRSSTEALRNADS